MIGGVSNDAHPSRGERELPDPNFCKIQAKQRHLIYEQFHIITMGGGGSY
jgi:hypothetical protein